MQKLRYSQYFKFLFVLVDVIILISTLLLISNTKIFSENKYFISVFWIVSWFLISGRTMIYHNPRTITYTKYLERLGTQLIFFTVATMVTSQLSTAFDIGLGSFRIMGALSFLFFLIKSSLFFLIKWARLNGFNQRNIMFLGASPATELLRNTLSERKDYGFKIIDLPSPHPHLEELKEFWKKNGIHTMYLPAKPMGDDNSLISIMRAAEQSRVKTTVIPDLISDDFAGYQVSYTETQPILQRAKPPLDYFMNAVVKRLFDIVFSLFFIIFIGSWLFPIIGILIKLDSKGSVFFIQKRYGHLNNIFHCMKFRTMVENSDCETKTTEVNDKRITKIGRFLRRTSLDETPQFLNVLLGNMSIVGPRPHMLAVDDHFREFISKYSVRSMVKPGITGLAQIRGLRGDAGNTNIEMQKRFLADAFYVNNWSPSLDAVILLKTAILLLRGDKKAY